MVMGKVSGFRNAVQKYKTSFYSFYSLMLLKTWNRTCNLKAFLHFPSPPPPPLSGFQRFWMFEEGRVVKMKYVILTQLSGGNEFSKITVTSEHGFINVVFICWIAFRRQCDIWIRKCHISSTKNNCFRMPPTYHSQAQWECHSCWSFAMIAYWTSPHCSILNVSRDHLLLH